MDGIELRWCNCCGDTVGGLSISAEAFAGMKVQGKWSFPRLRAREGSTTIDFRVEMEGIVLNLDCVDDEESIYKPLLEAAGGVEQIEEGD